MRRPSKPALLGVLTACACLAAPAGASASSPLNEYQQTGTITPCKYSAGQLQGDVPNDVAQYAPEYQSELQAAARERANGCGGGSAAAGGNQSGTGGGVTGVGGSGGGGGGGNGPAPRPPRAPAAKPIGPRLEIPRSVSPSASGVGTTPGPVLALSVFALLALLGTALALVAGLLGWGSGWAAPGRHALREAGMRIAAAVTGILDWARARGTSGA